MRHVHGVAAFDLDNGRACSFGHRPLGVWREHLVFGRDEVPAWLCPHDGWVIAPLSAPTPHGTLESAMNEATSGLTSAAFAMEQPAEVDVNEIVIRPTTQV